MDGSQEEDLIDALCQISDAVFITSMISLYNADIVREYIKDNPSFALDNRDRAIKELNAKWVEGNNK